MGHTSNESNALDARVNSALQDFLERTDRGENVDQEQFLAGHPEIADQLRSFILDAADLAHRAVIDSIPSAEVSTNQSVSETIAPQSSAGLPALPEVFGRYRLQRLLGRGAMGAVYLAQDTQLSRKVAIKVPTFHHDQSDEILQRFYIEARAAATLRNPHICPVYDVGEIAGWHYISMAYIEGHSLSDVIKANGAQPERQVLLLIRKLALALQEAHNQGIIHRDLKPGNVMLDTRGEPVVMDFGLACQTREGAERITASGVILGSPAYMPPEQLEGNSAQISPAADQYALGVILYELLTGELPFRGSISAVISQIITKPAPSPRLLRPDLDLRVEALCLQMLSKTPEVRLESMKAVADRIVAILKQPLKAGATEATKATIPSVPTNATASKKKEAVPNAGAVTITPASAKPAPAKEINDATESGTHHQKISTLCLLAAKLIRKHDYDQACRILSSIPSESRTDELTEMLDNAEEKSEESRLLLKDIEHAIRNDQPKDLPALVRRFLQLKPGNKAMQTLAKELQEFGAERVIRTRRSRSNFLDPAGRVWNPVHIAGYLIGLAVLCVIVYM
jgi:serine/threonine protein kinase